MIGDTLASLFAHASKFSLSSEFSPATLGSQLPYSITYLRRRYASSGEDNKEDVTTDSSYSLRPLAHTRTM
jgi:hypothetical protein